MFLISTPNHLIQKPKLLVLMRATNLKHFHSHLDSRFSTVHQSQSKIWVCKWFIFFLLSLLIISLIFLFDWWKVIWMMLIHMLGLYDWLIFWVYLLWFHINILLINLNDMNLILEILCDLELDCWFLGLVTCSKS